MLRKCVCSKFALRNEENKKQKLVYLTIISKLSHTNSGEAFEYGFNGRYGTAVNLTKISFFQDIESMDWKEIMHAICSKKKLLEYTPRIYGAAHEMIRYVSKPEHYRKILFWALY